MILSSLTVLLTLTVFPSLSTTFTVYDGLTYPLLPPLPPEEEPPPPPVEVLTGTVILPFASVDFVAVLLSLSVTVTEISLTAVLSLPLTVTVV